MTIDFEPVTSEASRRGSETATIDFEPIQFTPVEPQRPELQPMAVAGDVASAQPGPVPSALPEPPPSAAGEFEAPPYLKAIEDAFGKPVPGATALTAAAIEANPFTQIARYSGALIPGASDIVEGAIQGTKEAAAGFFTPENIALALSGAGEGAVGARVVTGGFAALAAKQFPEQYRAFQDAPDWREKTRIATNIAVGMGLPVMGFAGTFVKPKPPPNVDGRASPAGAAETGSGPVSSAPIGRNFTLVNGKYEWSGPVKSENVSVDAGRGKYSEIAKAAAEFAGARLFADRPIKIKVIWDDQLGSKHGALGASSTSKDGGSAQVYISPKRTGRPEDVARTVVHELVHT